MLIFKEKLKENNFKKKILKILKVKFLENFCVYFKALPLSFQNQFEF